LAEGCAELGLKRSDVFMTTKLWNTDHHPDHVGTACRDALKELQLNYLDLFLIHWPVSFAHVKDPKSGRKINYPTDSDGRAMLVNIPLIETWKAMEKLVDSKLCRSIGVSNFTVEEVQNIVRQCRIHPAVNQVECHPFLPQTEMRDHLRHHRMHVMSYSPLGNVGSNPQYGEPHETPLENKTVNDIARETGKSPAQVLIRWNLQIGNVVIPKSVTPQRIRENFSVLDFVLTPAMMDRLNTLGHAPHRFLNPTHFRSRPNTPFFAK